MSPGAATSPTSAVNTTRNITRGFISAKYSATSPLVGGGQDFRARVETGFGHALLTLRMAKVANPSRARDRADDYAVPPLFVI